MIKIYFVSFLLLFSASAYSQSNGEYMYSVGVRGYSYMQMPKIMNQTGNSYLNASFNSFIIKFNDNLFSYRLNGSYLSRDENFSNNCENCEVLNGKVKDYSFKVGFEKNFTYSKFQPYFALDLGYRSNKFDGTSTNINPILNSSNAVMPVPPNEVIATKEGFTITPVLGIKISPVKQISIFVETNLEFYYSYERQESVPQDALNVRSLNRFHKTEYLLNPVSVGIQFHIGNKN
ncbi:hypothetical protein HDE69_003415 [Pedobacter cryoconitis]|uniref:Outer membrane protein beta-barrel domain-containing protein n=1 Tax=Pedobacter cryoconitis TaxID=188932 RepID=A0A7W8YV30_9SPHI|nr:hypothetical protein [Pedobacter cryoconitis]MBB5622340.1 hypothetical protein [Pedobacter cryoconitis]